MQIANISNLQTMSTREIADLIEKNHSNIKISAERLAEKDVIGTLAVREFLHNGNIYTEYLLNKRDSLILVAQNSPEFTAKIVDRWQELEEKQAKTKTELSTLEILHLALESEKGRLLAIEQRDNAIATKAEIGNRREATAMATASHATKKATRLEIELDKSKEYATVKRMEMLYHGTKFNWRLLKSTAIEMEVPPIDVFDANYGKVNAYHCSVWIEAYAVSVDGPA